MCLSLAGTQDRDVSILAAPGNPGTAAVGRNVDVAASDIHGLVRLAREESVDLVVPGPEISLVEGVADACSAAGIPCCGPSAAAARLEGSKAFTRTLTAEAGVPSPRYLIVESSAEVAAAVASFEVAPVIKADGLAGGKGVFLPDSAAACEARAHDLLGGSLGDAGRRVVFEERLSGVEASLFYACSGTSLVALPHAQDYKRLEDDDLGPNTGGMGAISPNPVIDGVLEKTVRETIVLPILETMADRGTPFAGFLYAGLMLTTGGPKLLEFNVRLGDPEAQAILPRLEGDGFLDVCLQTAHGHPEAAEPDVDAAATCAVVLAAQGYPQVPRTGDPIEILPGLDTPERWLVHAGTRRRNGDLVTAGGRVAAVVARDDTVARARRSAYEGLDMIHWRGMTARRDIGTPQRSGSFVSDG